VHQAQAGLPGVRHADHPRIGLVTDPTEISAQTLAQRYGADRPRRRGPVIAAAAVLVTALLVWASWAAWFQDEPSIEANVTAYDVVSTHEVRVEVAVHFRDKDPHGSCLLRASARDHSIVGERNMTAAELRDARGSWISIRTERRATTATLVRCTD
jgi:hypothetical protein